MSSQGVCTCQSCHALRDSFYRLCHVHRDILWTVVYACSHRHGGSPLSWLQRPFLNLLQVLSAKPVVVTEYEIPECEAPKSTPVQVVLFPSQLQREMSFLSPLQLLEEQLQSPHQREQSQCRLQPQSTVQCLSLSLFPGHTSSLPIQSLPLNLSLLPSPAGSLAS